jgi:hypothetical protein
VVLANRNFVLHNSFRPAIGTVSPKIKPSQHPLSRFLAGSNSIRQFQMLKFLEKHGKTSNLTLLMTIKKVKKTCILYFKDLRK